jgi:hypothetical protein
LKAEVALWSTQIICLSLFEPVEKVASKVQVEPPLVDL